MKFENRVALVTGSGSGIGAAIAKRLARGGATIVVNDINATGAAATVKEIVDAGGKAEAVLADITKKADIDAMYAIVMEKFGRLDILVNNAGFDKSRSIFKIEESEWDAVVDTNLKGCFLCSQGAAKIMGRQNYGRIINISSRAWLGGPGQSCYSSAKGGVVSLTRTMALELGRYQITSNCIAPGLIHTPAFDALPEADQQRLLKIQPTGKIGSAEDIANMAEFFASEEASYVTGQVIYVCGGKSLFASLSV